MSLTIRGDPLERMKAKEAAEGQAERIAEVWAEGIAEKAAEFLLWVLARRGLTVPAQLRERVLSCVDLEQLGVWLEKSASANSVEDVFPG